MLIEKQSASASSTPALSLGSGTSSTKEAAWCTRNELSVCSMLLSRLTAFWRDVRVVGVLTHIFSHILNLFQISQKKIELNFWTSRPESGHWMVPRMPPDYRWRCSRSGRPMHKLGMRIGTREHGLAHGP